MSNPPPLPVVTSGPPPGFVTVRSSGLRVTVPIAVVAAILSSLATRLASNEARMSEQARTIQTLRAVCEQRKGREGP